MLYTLTQSGGDLNNSLSLQKLRNNHRHMMSIWPKTVQTVAAQPRCLVYISMCLFPITVFPISNYDSLYVCTTLLSAVAFYLWKTGGTSSAGSRNVHLLCPPRNLRRAWWVNMTCWCQVSHVGIPDGPHSLLFPSLSFYFCLYLYQINQARGNDG